VAACIADVIEDNRWRPSGLRPQASTDLLEVESEATCRPQENPTFEYAWNIKSLRYDVDRNKARNCALAESVDDAGSFSAVSARVNSSTRYSPSLERRFDVPRVLDRGTEYDRRFAIGMLPVVSYDVAGDRGLVYPRRGFLLDELAETPVDAFGVDGRRREDFERRKPLLADTVSGRRADDKSIERVAQSGAIKADWCSSNAQNLRTRPGRGDFPPHRRRNTVMRFVDNGQPGLHDMADPTREGEDTSDLHTILGVGESGGQYAVRDIEASESPAYLFDQLLPVNDDRDRVAALIVEPRRMTEQHRLPEAGRGHERDAPVLPERVAEHFKGLDLARP
jgi:hypothetical protein